MIFGCSKKPRQVLPAADQFKLAKGLYDKGKYFKAQTEFENLIYSYPGNTVVDTAQYYLGMCHYNQKDYGLAAGEFKRLLTSYPQSMLADDSQYYIGMCHFKLSPKYSLDQSETYLAIDEFNALFSSFPTSEYVGDSKQRVKELEDKLAQKSFMAGKLYFKMHDYQSALTYFSFVRDNYPATDWAIQAFYYTGETQMALGQEIEAKQTFESFLVGFSNHKLADKAKSKLNKLTELASNSES
jgi:outer membrane protein assembly factor BamD